jgi:hypothetical protein
MANAPTEVREPIIWLNPSITWSRHPGGNPQMANTISRRGPGQQPEVITGELTFAIGRQGSVNDLASP